MDGPDLELCQVDHSAAVRRRVHHGIRRGPAARRAVARWVGGNSFTANFVASVIGAMWYFATLTEIPILEALFGLGMGTGPGAGAAAGRPGTFAAQHRGDLQRDRLQEDGGVRGSWSCDEHGCRHGVWRVVL